MAGLCGCWHVGASSNGGCDGCGYKILLRGALASSSRPLRPPAKVSDNDATSGKPPLPPARHKKERRDGSQKREASKGAEDIVPSHHRRHSHPVRSPPEAPPDSLLPRSLQRRKLPQSSAYNVPLPPPSPHTLVSLVPPLKGTRETIGPPLYPNQPLLLSTIQPPPELCPPTSILPPSPLDKTPPFDVSSFLPSPSTTSASQQLTPPPSSRTSLPGLIRGVSASTSLQVRYRALSLARAACTTRSHSDLRTYDDNNYDQSANDQRNKLSHYRHSDFQPTSEYQSISQRVDQEGLGNHLDLKDYQAKNSSQHPSPTQYMSRTLPTPGPPQPQKRYVVKQPQHTDNSISQQHNHVQQPRPQPPPVPQRHSHQQHLPITRKIAQLQPLQNLPKQHPPVLSQQQHQELEQLGFPSQNFPDFAKPLYPSIPSEQNSNESLQKQLLEIQLQHQQRCQAEYDKHNQRKLDLAQALSLQPKSQSRLSSDSDMHEPSRHKERKSHHHHHKRHHRHRSSRSRNQDHSIERRDSDTEHIPSKATGNFSQHLDLMDSDELECRSLQYQPPNVSEPSHLTTAHHYSSLTDVQSQRLHPSESRSDRRRSGRSSFSGKHRTRDDSKTSKHDGSREHQHSTGDVRGLELPNKHGHKEAHTSRRKEHQVLEQPETSDSQLSEVSIVTFVI